jgi:hypothetical protein
MQKICLGLAIATVCCQCLAQESISLATEETPITAEIVRRGGEPGHLWVEIQEHGKRHRVEESRYYALFKEHAIGILDAISGLILRRELEADQDPGEAAFFIRWAAIFGATICENDQAAFSRYAQIVKVGIVKNELQLQLNVRGQRAIITFDSDLKLTTSELDGERIPILNQPGLLLNGDVTVPLIKEVAASANARNVYVWHGILESGNNGQQCLAKTIIDGDELTWFGKYPAHWLELNGMLVGVTQDAKALEISFRNALRSQDLPKTNVFLSASTFDLGGRFADDVISLKREDPNLRDVIEPAIRNVSVQGESIIVTFSQEDFGRIKFSPVQREAILINNDAKSVRLPCQKRTAR